MPAQEQREMSMQKMARLIKVRSNLPQFPSARTRGEKYFNAT
jgi:hypothetical protein